MKRKGGGRNERKANELRAAQASALEQEARVQLKELRARPLGRRQPDFDDEVRRLTGILRKAVLRRKKSETHSRREKGGTR